MSSLSLLNQQAFFGAYKISNATNAMALEVGADAVEVTTFGSGGNREYVGGLKTAGFSMQGFMEAIAGLDAGLDASLGLQNVPVTFASVAGTAGEVAYILRGLKVNYSRKADMGDAFGFSLEGNNSDDAGAVRGVILHNSIAINGDGNGTAFQVGAISSTQRLYAALHVFSVAGTDTPTLTLKLQSDTSGFASATDRISFDAVTAVGSQWKELDGPVTDDYWRVNIDVAGTNPVFGAILTIGIK